MMRPDYRFLQKGNILGLLSEKDKLHPVCYIRSAGEVIHSTEPGVSDNARGSSFGILKDCLDVGWIGRV